jgi:hypothetical protein
MPSLVWTCHLRFGVYADLTADGGRRPAPTLLPRQVVSPCPYLSSLFQ